MIMVITYPVFRTVSLVSLDKIIQAALVIRGLGTIRESETRGKPQITRE